MTLLSAEARNTWLLTLILLIGMILRVAYALQQPTLVQFTGADGGDSAGYLANGAGFFSGKEHGWIRGFPFYNSNLKPAPLYIIFVGGFPGVSARSRDDHRYTPGAMSGRNCERISRISDGGDHRPQSLRWHCCRHADGFSSGADHRAGEYRYRDAVYILPRCWSVALP